MQIGERYRGAIKSIYGLRTLTDTQLIELLDELRFSPRYPQKNGVSITVEPIQDILRRIVGIAYIKLPPITRENQKTQAG